MQLTIAATALVVGAGLATAAPTEKTGSNLYPRNPYAGKHYFQNSHYVKELDITISNFLKQGDELNAARTRSAQKAGTFAWISSTANLTAIPQLIREARIERLRTGKSPIVQIVHYDLPDRDCSAGESAGEFDSEKDGLNLYKTKFVDVFARELRKAPDLQFAIVLEPDSVGNIITNQGVEKCKKASPVYEEGIAYAIKKLQFPNVALYIDAAHGGWLGWADNLAPTANEFAKIVKMAGKKARIRGFATNVSNYNPYIANPRANYTEWSPSYDEFHYTESLGAYLANVSVPNYFIVDQGRAGLQNTRSEWGQWCNVRAGYGILPTTKTNSSLVDSIVWVKPGGESDGACGMEGAPAAGQWWDEYAQMLVKNADPPLQPIYKKGGGYGKE